MTTCELWITTIVQVLLCVAVVAGSWFCYRRTRIVTFLVLGVFIAFLWPGFDAIARQALRYSVEHVYAGKRPQVFPFSLMVSGFWGWSGWQMPPGEFVCKFNFAMNLLQYSLLAALFALLARALRKVGRREDAA